MIRVGSLSHFLNQPPLSLFSLLMSPSLNFIIIFNYLTDDSDSANLKRLKFWLFYIISLGYALEYQLKIVGYDLA